MSKPQREETPPEWLDQSFLENSLKKGFKNDDLKILESEMKMATAVGDNYASQMFRFNLTLKTKKEGTKEKLSVIVKSLPPGRIGEEMQKLCFFEKEGEAFSKILPRINALLQKAYPDHKKLWANCYYHQGSPDNLLILEDLRPAGFVLGSRFEGLDMEHSVLALKSLAKLHAASLVLRRQSPEMLDMFNHNFWNSDNADSIQKMMTSPFAILSEAVPEWTGFERRQEFSEKLKAVEGSILPKVFDVWKIDESKLNVLLHGDAWVNNFMFRYDPTGKLNGINFVDFQLMNMNSPALDLQYFIFTSTSLDIRFDYVDLFLQTYHETFEDTLERLGHRLDKPYTLDHLKKDFEEKYFWGFTVFCTIFPLFVLPSNEVFHPDEFFKGDESSSFKNAYNRGDLKNFLQRGFLFFEDKGVF